MYGFGAIIEQEIVASAADDIAANNFQLRVMDVPGSNNEYYIGFLQCPDLPDVRLNTEDKLKISFDLKHGVQATEWSATIINSLLFASPGVVYTTFFCNAPIYPILGSTWAAN